MCTSAGNLDEAEAAAAQMGVEVFNDVILRPPLEAAT